MGEMRKDDLCCGCVGDLGSGYGDICRTLARSKEGRERVRGFWVMDGRLSPSILPL